MSSGQSVLYALPIAVVLAALHTAAPALRRLSGVRERAFASFAGGIAVAYVFLHLLPELSAGNRAIGEALEDLVEPTPLLELAIFLVALLGFTVFYALERLSERRGDHAGDARLPLAYDLHLGCSRSTTP